MPSIFLILYSRILHIFTLLSDIYSAADMCKPRSNHSEVLYEVLGNILENIYGPTSMKLRKGQQLYEHSTSSRVCSWIFFKISRTAILKNTCEQLLLYLVKIMASLDWSENVTSFFSCGFPLAKEGKIFS